MSDLLSLTRAARLVGVNRAALQKKIKNGELTAFDGMVTVENLLTCYPDAQLEDTAEFRRVSLIKEQAFGKRVFERALPDAEVLAVRLTELSKLLAGNQAQVKRFNQLLNKLWDKLGEIEKNCNAESHETLENLKSWIKQEANAAMEPGFSNPLAIKDGMLRVMAAQVSILPSKHDFLVEGQDTLLEAAMRSGIPLNYGCSGGNCGLCKAKLISGQVKKTHAHDFVISEADKNQGYILLCSNTAVSDVVIEAPVAGSVQDIPYQQLIAKVKEIIPLFGDMLLLHLQTPRTQRLRFLAGQRVTLRVGQSYFEEMPIASCPCDDRNLIFHLRRLPGNLFSDYIFESLKRDDPIEVEGPQGEFILHEKSPRVMYFIAMDGGFAPIKSIIEHAMSLDAETIHLHWIGSSKAHIYLPNVARAWADALDNFHYEEHVAGFDLHSISGSREENFRKQLEKIVAADQELSQGEVYIAGPESALEIAERLFLELGMPRTRVSLEMVK